MVTGTPYTRSDLEGLLKLAAENEVIDQDARTIMEGALLVGDMQARDAMIPRAQMVVIRDSATLQEVLQHTTTPNLDFISAGPLPVNPAELIAGLGLAKLIDQIKDDYDIILVDAPPVLGLADAPTLASHVDATLFVVQANHARGRQPRIALTRLKAARAYVVGALLTKFDAKVIGHSTDYGYSYSYGQTDQRS